MCVMKLSLERYMEDIETRLNEEDELRLLADWDQWLQHTNKAGSAFSPAKRSSVSSTLDWPHVNINDTIKDDDLAIYRELEVVNANLYRGNNCFHHIRVNTGVGNMASALGAKPFTMPYKADTRPNVYAMGGERAYARCLRWIVETFLPSGELAAALRRFSRIIPKSFASFVGNSRICKTPSTT